MTDEIVTIKGIKVKVVPERLYESGCDRCAFINNCPTIREENEAGVTECIEGDHYYEKVDDAQD
ncbi:MAG: hypothetical protein ING25_10915 [Burkholderiales bacterium]|nr:hypothetical protein [Burkholderiales bacterium]